MSAVNTIVGADLLVDHPTEAGTVRALECDRIVVDSGSSVAIMGPSGCGKSTLLGLIAGLALPTRGSVTVGDVAVSELAERERVRFRRQVLGMVYQADNLLPHMTVEENIGLQRAICRRDAGEERGEERGDDGGDDPLALLDRLGLAGLAKRLPDQLSGGQRQRVAVARAIVHRPAVILADEPTGALDANSARVVIDLLIEVQRHINASLVIVTHDPQIADHADRTVQLARPDRMPELAHAR